MSFSTRFDPVGTDVNYGRATVLFGVGNGKYPDGNAIVVTGSDASALIDPTLTVHQRGEQLAPAVDMVLLSHAHEDHMAGLSRFPHADVHVHHADHQGVTHLEGLMDIYGMLDAEFEQHWRHEVVQQFNYRGRPDARSFNDDTVFDLGGASVQVIPLPGHTRGHCGFLIEPDGLFYMADIDLSSFGPYYADAWSNLDAMEASLTRCAEVDARRYATFHHKGVFEDRASYLAALRDFRQVIARRESAMLAFLSEPRTLDELIVQRFLYRPDVTLGWVDGAERRTAVAHLNRLIPAGAVQEIEPGRYRTMAA
ncbi:MAG: MBL fold metallo-hydrolase [Acidimicrobiales bacterium]